MNKAKLSLVIAMYNIEEYIVECLEQCIYQEKVNTDDYEIILVNDGSTDRSYERAAKILESVSNARIISQENAGLSAARNTGLEYATGNYVWFIDGDDKIDTKAVYELKKNLVDKSCDVFIINYFTFCERQIFGRSDFESYNETLSGKTIHENYLRILPQMAWLSIYRTEFLRKNNLEFVKGLIHEDFEFSIRSHHLAQSIKIIPEALYYYRINRSDSIIGNIKKDNIKSLEASLFIISSLDSFFSQQHGQISKFGRYVLGIETYSFFQKLLSRTSKGEELDKVERLSRFTYKYLWHSPKKKHKLFYISYKALPRFIIAKIVSMDMRRLENLEKKSIKNV